MTKLLAEVEIEPEYQINGISMFILCLSPPALRAAGYRALFAINMSQIYYFSTSWSYNSSHTRVFSVLPINFIFIFGTHNLDPLIFRHKSRTQQEGDMKFTACQYRCIMPRDAPCQTEKNN